MDCFHFNDDRIIYCYFKKNTGAACIFDYGHFPLVYTWSDTLQLNRWEEGLEINFERGSINAETKSLSIHLLSFRKVIKEWFTKGEQEFSRIRDLPFKFPDSV